MHCLMRSIPPTGACPHLRCMPSQIKQSPDDNLLQMHCLMHPNFLKGVRNFTNASQLRSDTAFDALHSQPRHVKENRKSAADSVEKDVGAMQL
eukprot:1090821-Pelagomonas_calceolata.AAC.5